MYKLHRMNPIKHSGPNDGGLTTFTLKLQQAVRTAYETGKLDGVKALRLEEDKYWRQERNLSKASAERALNQAEDLHAKPLNPDRTRMWVELLEGLSPGLYARYILKSISEAALVDGPLRNRLLEIQRDWRQEHGQKIFYNADLKQLDQLLNPPAPTTARQIITSARKLVGL